MSARRRVERVFGLYARGAAVSEDMPLRYYILGDDTAVVVVLPFHLTFRPGGRPRYAHLLPDPDDQAMKGSRTADRTGYALLGCDDWYTTGPFPVGRWWFKRNDTHQRQVDACICDSRPAWGVIDCPVHGLVVA